MSRLQRKLDAARCLAKQGATPGERAAGLAAVMRLEARIEQERHVSVRQVKRRKRKTYSVDMEFHQGRRTRGVSKNVHKDLQKRKPLSAWERMWPGPEDMVE